MNEAGTRHWLDRYGKGYHNWVREENGFARPCGLLEARFDSDARYFGGRGDLNPVLTLGLSTRLSNKDLQHHILLAFTFLRLKHCLLAAKAELRTLGVEPWFSVGIPATSDAAIQDAASALQFLDPAVDGEIDLDEFQVHAKNVARLVKPSETLARGLVFPIESKGSTRKTLRIMFAMAHEILDGLSLMNWIPHFIRILNMPPKKILQRIEKAILPDSIRATLPPAQEDLYAPVASTKARTRWFWAITIVLRHVKKPMPTAFPNPLRRDAPLLESKAFPPKYPNLLDYSQKPPLNTFAKRLSLSPAASQRLYRLCREAKATIGAGGFVLVAMVMMAIHEARYPDEPDDARRPFVGSFPLNIRPFIGAKIFDNAMMGFCEGIVLPFLPSHLDLEGRFRLLVRQASRQLSAYQKRERPQSFTDAEAYMGIRGAGRLIASNYIDGIERLRDILPAHLKDAIPPPQGEYEVPDWSVSRATCGISSVGLVDWSPAKFDLNADPGDGVIASIEHLQSGPRVRDNEFLVATMSEDGVIHAGASFDGNFIDENNAPGWAEKMISFLEVLDAQDPKARL
ncbi:hypothetical protein HD806DRAFT_349395 [Xylariaceae sp. AK1471]|nr:hypothetical protein HD806DRAFT_349395 [Xylariaceae sp. AK1471]